MHKMTPDAKSSPLLKNDIETSEKDFACLESEDKDKQVGDKKQVQSEVKISQKVVKNKKQKKVYVPEDDCKVNILANDVEEDKTKIQLN